MGQLIDPVKMADIPPHCRPREKARLSGIESLSDVEVLALILRSGTRSDSVLSLAQRLLTLSKGLVNLPRLSLYQLMTIPGIKEAKAAELQAVFELTRRVLRSDLPNTNIVERPDVLVDWLKSEIGNKNQEHFLVVYLNTQNQILACKTLFIGTLDRSIIHPREIFKEAVENSASRLIAVHNHPGGSLKASDQDLEVTQMLMEAGSMMGIPLLDHLIITNQGYCSLRQKMIVD
jgi:DNA repair protein RadC